MNSKDRRRLRRVKDDANRPWEYDSIQKQPDQPSAAAIELHPSGGLPFWVVALLYAAVCVVIDMGFPGHRALLGFGAVAVTIFCFVPGDTVEAKLLVVVSGAAALFLAAVVFMAFGLLTKCSSGPVNFDWVRSL
jgi:lipopolysaccharide export LptBFGC system permease protein LptF